MYGKHSLLVLTESRFSHQKPTVFWFNCLFLPLRTWQCFKLKTLPSANLTLFVWHQVPEETWQEKPQNSLSPANCPCSSLQRPSWIKEHKKYLMALDPLLILCSTPSSVEFWNCEKVQRCWKNTDDGWSSHPLKFSHVLQLFELD